MSANRSLRVGMAAGARAPTMGGLGIESLYLDSAPSTFEKPLHRLGSGPGRALDPNSEPRGAPDAPFALRGHPGPGVAEGLCVSSS